MITSRILAALALVPFCLPARAQDAPGLAACRQLLDQLPAVDPAAAAAASITAPDANTCRFAPMRFAWSRFVGYSMESLTVAGLDAAATITPGKPVLIEAHAVRNAPSFPSPVAAYISKVGAIPFDVAVEFTSDPGSNRFTLRQFSMTGESVGLVQLMATLTNVEVADQPLAAPVPLASDPSTMGLASLSLRLDNHGFVERMVTPGLAGFLAASSPPQADPEPIVEAKKQEIAALLAAAPALYGLPPPTADALTRFVQDFPHPTGSLQCSLTADPPVQLPADPTPAAIRALVTAAHPSCTYAKG